MVAERPSRRASGWRVFSEGAEIAAPAPLLWRDRRVVVEADSSRHHRGRRAFRGDRGRDLELRARGFEAIRLSEEQVDDGPERVAEILREVLASRPHRVGPDGEQETRRPAA